MHIVYSMVYKSNLYLYACRPHLRYIKKCTYVLYKTERLKVSMSLTKGKHARYLVLLFYTKFMGVFVLFCFCFLLS